MDTDVDPALATLENPWDPEQRAGRGLSDATYYKGRYYLYFGITPILLLFLPFRVLTGFHLGEPLACLVFAVVGYGLAVWLFRLVRRRYFPQTSMWMEAGCVLVLGLGTMMPVLLRRPSMWEVPITCGNASS